MNGQDPYWNANRRKHIMNLQNALLEAQKQVEWLQKMLNAKIAELANGHDEVQQLPDKCE